MKRLILAAALLYSASGAASTSPQDEQTAFWACSTKSNLAAVAAASKFSNTPLEEFLSNAAETMQRERLKEVFAMILRVYEMPIRRGTLREDFVNEAKGDAIGRCMQQAGFDES